MSKTIADYTAAITIDGANDFLLIEPSGNTVYKKISRNILLGLSSAPLGTTDSQSPTNKTLDNTNTITLKDTLFTLQDDGDTSKQARFQLSGITTATTRTYTLPNASDTLAGIATAQTLTNKTITSPTITGGTIDNSTITVDSIAGHTSSTIVTIAGMQISSGVINSANAVTSTSIAAGAVQPQALVTGTGTGWTWQSFTPTLANMTLGNGTLACNYTQIGKTVVGRFYFKLGTTSAVGTGPSFTPPATPAAYYGTHDNFIVGQGLVFAGATTAPSLGFFNASVSAISLAYFDASNVFAAMSATLPGTFANNNYITVDFQYEAA